MSKEPNKIELKIEGMNCANCALGIQKRLIKNGFENVNVNFSLGEAQFSSSSKKQLNDAIQEIESMGYKVVSQNQSENQKPKWYSLIELKFYFALIFTIPLVSAMFLPFDIIHNPYFQLALAVPVFIVGLFHFGKSAYHSILSGIPNMDVLVILGATASFSYSLIGTIFKLGHDYQFYESAAAIITLILLGNMLEHSAIKKTTSAVEDLIKFQKVIAKRITKDMVGNEIIQEIETANIQRSDNLLINTGDKIPVDGEIIEGTGSIDESMISGESIPIEKTIGDKLIGGTLLLSGSIKMKVQAIGKQTMLSQIIELVKKAQQDKPQLQNLADKISAVFVPAVISISILTFVLSFYVFNIDISNAFMRSIAVLVIACPCALGLAIPTAVMVGIGRVARNGILIKGASTIQQFVNIKKIVFDKTGTLTTGNFKIRTIQCFDKSREFVCSVLINLEQHSSHPIAKSILKELKETKKIQLKDHFEEKGLSVSAYDEEGNHYVVGSYTIASKITDDDTHHLYLLENFKLIAYIDIEDEIKLDAAETIAYFVNKGIQPILLSGDRKIKCDELAAKIGITEVYSEKLPHEKLEIIEMLSKESDIAMVGDGINDAPALAKARVGISLSNGTQIAIQSAQIILLKGKLKLLTTTYSISKNTLTIIKQNFFWAFIYNVIAIPIAAFGLLNPMIAAACMALSDVFVVLNSLRLRNKKLM